MRNLLAVFVLFLAVPAAAVEIQKSGPENFPSKHELSPHIGYQAGVGGTFQNPSGLKIGAEYAFRFHELIWFDLQASNVFGFGSTGGPCVGVADSSCYRGGWAFGLAGGIKLKWRTPVPLVVEVPVLLGVDVLYNRDCGDNGAAGPLVRSGGSLKYFVTRNIGLGAAINFAFGPGFHEGTSAPQCKRSSYVDFYGAFDFSLVAEFLL